MSPAAPAEALRDQMMRGLPTQMRSWPGRPLSRPITLVALLVVAVLAGTAGSAQATHLEGAEGTGCGAFTTQAAAQDVYEANGGPAQDPYGLDLNNDGNACTSLPCPCRFGGVIAPPQPGLTPPGASHEEALAGRVVRVRDGETIVVAAASGEIEVRLLGIDTPRTSPRRECGGAEATRVMKRLASPGETVQLVTDSTQETRDGNGRLVAYVTGADGKLLQTEALARGWAKVDVSGRRFTRFGSFRRAERRARERRLGVWRSCGGRVHRPLRGR